MKLLLKLLKCRFSTETFKPKHHHNIANFIPKLADVDAKDKRRESVADGTSDSPVHVKENRKSYLLPSSLSFYTTHPVFFDMVSLLNEIFRKIAPSSSLNLSNEDISHSLMLDIPQAIKFPSEMPKKAKNKAMPNFSIIYSMDKLKDDDAAASEKSLANCLSLRSLLDDESMKIWKPHDEMEKILGCPLSERMYYRLCLKLSLVQKVYETGPYSKSLADFLDGWRRLPGDIYSEGASKHGPTIYRLRATDALGRTYTTGTKKCAKAELWLYPIEHAVTDSQRESIHKYPSAIWPIFVNGKPMHIYFEGDIKIMTTLTAPLELADRYDKYCVWASVNGGGKKGNGVFGYMVGRADAVKIALSRALASREPELLPILDPLVQGDGRRVERKKYGKAKARRSFTWVKR